MTVTLRLYRPADLAGRLICWRLESGWSHATLAFDDVLYSATLPRIEAVGPHNATFGMPPRMGQAFTLRLDAREAEAARAWCQAQVGAGYDLLAILGWALRIRAWQSRRRLYCFELVYDALCAAGVFAFSKRFVTGDQLLADLYAAGRIGPVPEDSLARAARQPRAMLVRRVGGRR